MPSLPALDDGHGATPAPGPPNPHTPGPAPAALIRIPGTALSLYTPPRGEDCKSPWIILRRRKFRAKSRKNSAVEVVPTPGKILRLNRCFLKIPDLIVKKPCYLEALENAQKPHNRKSMSKFSTHRGPFMAEK